uniref:Uncharacterized protein n=1 Tax=Chromera velia CCMP2878 TaxID=1169474 RepID=A0A0G4FT71_9ALVE|eukprot:Cvel_18624.t1-p1 / transcript=Cvel_18624.t1 / gene=Cvel_18624 / organism=Chromera_velia_CCMP2878 / gene_product=hypothetical protein / transcript_product=hypothetical protein / location=Cvel_scaffold1555:6573-6923(+) / protein_length=117 / sequence_SO=supercontig / SO=protein_coding / is_pseudo=false
MQGGAGTEALGRKTQQTPQQQLFLDDSAPASSDPSRAVDGTGGMLNPNQGCVSQQQTRASKQPPTSSTDLIQTGPPRQSLHLLERKRREETRQSRGGIGAAVEGSRMSAEREAEMEE